MKITAPDPRPPEGPKEDSAWCTGKLYIPVADYVAIDHRNPFLYISHPSGMLVRLCDGRLSFDISMTARPEWVDVTNQFELLHSEYL